MKRNDARDFCILYLEPGDDRDALFRAIAGQYKPVVLMLAEQSQLFQRPEEFVALKHLKRQLDVAIFFVIANAGRLPHLAERNGFPVYKSMDELGDALMVGHPARQRVLAPAPGEPTSAPYHAPRKTVPLSPLEEIVAHMPTMPIPAVASSLQPVRSSTSRPIASQPTQPTALSMPQPIVLPATQARAPAAREPVSPPEPSPKKGYRRLPAVLIALMILALSGAGLGSLLVLFHSPAVNMQAAPPASVGHVYFLSSGQVNENSNQGIDDEVQVDLSNLANPAPGKSYYAWLLSDKNQGETIAILLGVLAVKNGDGHLFYAGDQSHTNLLAMTSRFLLTEEDSSVMPVAPSPDYSIWRYYGEFLQARVQTSGSLSGGMTSFSFLDHLRDLLVADPMLDENELPGGLNTWFSHNTQEVLAWTSSMRESWQESKDTSFIRRQAVSTLAYLDGLSYVVQDLPPNTPLDVNDRLARIGLMEVQGPNQDPPCYLDSIVFHLGGLTQAGGSTKTLRKDAAGIIAAMNNVRYWLGQVRKDAQQIVKMTGEQLLQPATLALINDMIENASSAYAGQIDPTTGEMREGVTWIHDHIQTLATLEITAYRSGNSPVQLIPGSPSREVWYKREATS
ncbi:MAG: hypothetical protein ACJ8CB_01715 [Ktedonobacteraceae bacterium]